MLLTRSFAHRRATLLGLAGALALTVFLVSPQGQAIAASLLQLFRGQTVKAVPTDMAHIRNAYSALYDLQQLGTTQGTVPSGLNPVSSVAQAAAVSQLTLAQPSSLPQGINSTPKTQALAPSQWILTLSKAKADAYFQSQGWSLRMPVNFNGVQIIVNFPGVALLEYTGASSNKLYLGQAGQLDVKISVSNLTVTDIREFLVQIPNLNPDTAATVKNLTNWQTTIPLAIPTDRVGWSNTTVGGSYGGTGVIVNDNSGLGSAVLWQSTAGTRSLGLAGVGLKATELQTIAGSLK